MMEVHKLHRADVEFVAANLWDRGKIEAERLGVFTFEGLVDKLMSMAGEYGYALYAQNAPIAVLGAESAGKVYYTWFIATDEFLEHGKAATIFLRKFIRERVAERPDAQLVLWSAVDHADAPRWFELLGFEPTKRDGFFHGYIYKGKSLTSGAGCGNIEQAASQHSPS